MPHVLIQISLETTFILFFMYIFVELDFKFKNIYRKESSYNLMCFFLLWIV